MHPTHYEVLDAAPNATPEQLLAAYRKKVLRCHPDRGGSHEAMVEVNAAWEILSNPDARRNYDAEMAGAADPATREAVATEAAAARERAENYPRNWSTFSDWLDGVGRDLTGARYGARPSEHSPIPVPTVEGSASGVGCMLGGGLFGLLVVLAVVLKLAASAWDAGKDAKGSYWAQVGRMAAGNKAFAKGGMAVAAGIVVAGFALGAWAGVAVHRLFQAAATAALPAPDRDGGSGPPPPPPAGPEPPVEPAALSPPRKVTFACKRCGQKLRLPAVPGRYEVTCSTCRYRFPAEIVRKAKDSPPTDV